METFTKLLTNSKQNSPTSKSLIKSQLCQFGYKNPITKDLKVRTITCPVCGATYNRDLNAAINIDNESYRLHNL